jgi:plastocyanin
MMTLLQYTGHHPTGPVAAVLDSAGATGHQGHTAPAPATTADTPAPDTPPGTAQINLVDDRIDPPDLTVPVGTTVTWTNRGADWHSVAAFDGSFEVDRISPGETFTHRFDQAGSTQYSCKHHALPGMLGRINVI